MTRKEVEDKVQAILLRHFNIRAEYFHFETPLEILNEDFKILSNLVHLEQLLEKEFNRNIPLLENISTSFHSTKDVVDLIVGQG